ncbi:DUF7661 family protein [Pseudacidovorax sp. NFM-22]|uniref:DUF7661 family protein n=1 Tax=Pseudacidovorax sp. NFM-22 TaxID=2744469 RepID=UPI001F366AD8|nr:hypothetical protein [Pseudacidovorax sp. NFM-22]
MLCRFNLFGRIIAVERVGEAWTAYLVGNEGKRRPASLAIPSDLAPAELSQYLYDIYHEAATPTNGDVFEIPSAQNR